MKTLITLSILMTATACATQAPDKPPIGMWVCQNAYHASDLWDRVKGISGSGVNVTPEIFKQAALSKGCKRVTSAALRPVEEGDYPSTLLVANKDDRVGWVSTQYFILYMANPQVRSIRERN